MKTETAALAVLGAMIQEPGRVWHTLDLVKATRINSLYPALARLENQGLVTSEWEDDPIKEDLHRRVYTLVLSQSVYVVSWTGGYEAPCYVAFWDEAQAWERAHKWARDMKESEDTIDVLRIRLMPLSIERLEQDDAPAAA